jgi:tetratricopeptide (TPR) repeat protein
MAGPLQVALPESELGGRLAAGVGAAAPFLVAAAATGLVAADNGGYWPTSWGWSALAIAWVGGLALVLQEGRVSRLELAWIGGLAALTGWTALSWLWTSSGTSTALEVERTLVYLLAALAVAAVARSASYRGLLWGTWAGSSAACLYGLATRLFPERLGVSDVTAGYRLFSPIGYWNGLGLLAAVAVLLALGLATHGRRPPARALAAASLPLLVPTLYFTFSRGAWIALAGGLLAAAAVSHRRLALAAGLLVLALPTAAAVWLAYRAKPLRQTDASLASAVDSGHALAWKLLLVAAVAAGLSLGFGYLARGLSVPRGLRSGFAALLAATLVGGFAVLVVHYGGPAGVIAHARRSIDSSGPAQQGSDLSSRLFSLSSNGRLRQWHVALDEWHAHPVLGGGAGTYAQYWAAAGPSQGQLLDVHNLYLETLAELGPVGLALLVAALLVPLAAAVRARRRTLVPIATGAYVAWLVHVVYDWDWELPGVTIAALVCAGAVLAAARGQGTAVRQASARWGLLAVAAVAGTLALFGLLGNRALTSSSNALGQGNFAAAVSAANSARRWAPWSSQPWAQLALIHRLQGDRAAARAAYEQAVAKDPSNWQLWLGLLSVSTGTERAQALDRLSALSPAAATGVRGSP